MTSGTVQFSEYAQSTRLVFSANKICQIHCEHTRSDGVAILSADQRERGLWGQQYSGTALKLNASGSGAFLNSSVMKIIKNSQNLHGRLEQVRIYPYRDI